MIAPRSHPESATLKTGPVRCLDWPVLACGTVLVAGAIAAYGRTFSVPLLFDDTDSIANNLSIRHWSTALWPPGNTTVSGRPMLNLSLALNYAISGTAVWSYHAVNLMIHVLAGLTLFGVVRRTLNRKNSGMDFQPMERGEHGLEAHATRGHRTRATFIAFAVALLWTLHPLQTEAVTYIVQRAESLMGLFYLLTIYCFIRYAERGPSFVPLGGTSADKKAGTMVWGALSIGACLFGMATKEVMVSAPLIVLLYDRTFLAGSLRVAWKRHWRVYIGLGSTWVMLALLVLSTHGRGGTSGFGSGVSWWSYALTQFPAVVRYLKLSVWPRPLVFDYGTDWVTNGWSVVPCAVIVMGLVAATVWAFLRSSPPFYRSLSFAGVLFFAILAPTSLVPGNRQTAAEHRMYLALIPVVVLTVVGIYRWLGRAAMPVCLALAAGLFAITWQRNADYSSGLKLWTDTVAKRPGNAFAHNNLGNVLEKIPGRLDDAIAQIQEALRLKPDYADAHDNLGFVLNAEGRAPEAIVQFEESLRLNPNDAEAHDNLGIVLGAQGRTRDAIAQYEEALRLNPDYAEAHNNLGYILKAGGRTSDAISQFEEALRLEPDYAEAHNNLGISLKAEGRTAEAIAQYEAALRLNPGLAEAHNSLGVGLKAEGRTAEAVAQYKEALRLNPNFAEAHNNLGIILHDEGRTAEAIAQFEEASRLRPDDPTIHLNLAIVLLSTAGGNSAAEAHLEAVLRLQPANDRARQILAGIRGGQP